MLDSSGNLFVKSDVVGYSSALSDAKLKDNITTIDGALDKVLKLRGVEFDWNETSKKGKHDIGLIAQEVEEVLPELVNTYESDLFTEDGIEHEFKTVSYDKMVGVLINAIQELNEKINNK